MQMSNTIQLSVWVSSRIRNLGRGLGVEAIVGKVVVGGRCGRGICHLLCKMRG